MTDDELIAYLKLQGLDKDVAAADRIEELVKERKAMAMRDAGYDVYAGLEAKLAKVVKERDEAQAGNHAANEYEPTWAEAVDIWKVNSQRLEAKLAKAVEALQKIAVHPALWHTLASKVLAELEGDNV